MNKGGKIMVETKKSSNLLKNIRIVQAIFLGLFTLGISMCFGDIAPSLNIPVSGLSITTTFFGAMGYLMCEWFARKATEW